MLIENSNSQVNYNIIIENKSNEEFLNFVHMKLREYNDNNSSHHKAYRKSGAVQNIHIIAEDNKEWVGGLIAEVYWGWLNIEYLWVHDDYRKKGIGSLLLKEAEKTAIQQGCSKSQLSTFEFQARTFYERHAYKVVGQLADYPPGSTYYWMSKKLL